MRWACLALASRWVRAVLARVPRPGCAGLRGVGAESFRVRAGESQVPLRDAVVA